MAESQLSAHRPGARAALAAALTTLLLTLGAGLVLAPPASACSCVAAADPATELKRADAVFIAEPVASRSYNDSMPVGWTMAVREVLAGDVEIITEVRTGDGGSDCGREFVADGMPVAVVAVRNDAMGSLTTNSCTSTDIDSLRAAAAELGMEPHKPLGAPPDQAIIVGDDVQRAPFWGGPPRRSPEPVEGELVLVRALTALVAVALAMAVVVAFTSSTKRDDD